MLLQILYHADGLRMGQPHGIAEDTYFVSSCQKNILSFVMVYIYWSNFRIPVHSIYMCWCALKNEEYNNSCYSHSLRC